MFGAPMTRKVSVPFRLPIMYTHLVLDATSKVLEQEWREKAKKDLEEWNLRQTEQMERNRANNRYIWGGGGEENVSYPFFAPAINRKKTTYLTSTTAETSQVHVPFRGVSQPHKSSGALLAACVFVAPMSTFLMSSRSTGLC